MLDAQGDKVAESRHLPYGGERWRWPEDGTFPTDYRFTGQRWEQPLGIYTMGARWYDPALGRWLSADTLVPEPGNPQAFNRYSYVGGNSLRYRDPSGHQGGPGEQAAQWVQFISPEQAVYLAEALAVAGPVGLSTVGIGVLGYGWAQGYQWVINGPLGPDYPLPEEFNPDSLNATYPLPESSTLLIDNGMFFAASGAIQSMADHLGFLFGYGAAGLPNFPNPFDRHDPKKSGSDKNSGQHIKNALKGIQENLGKQDLGSYLQQALSEEEYASLSEALDNLVWDLQHQGYIYEQFGENLSTDILALLRQTGYILGP